MTDALGYLIGVVPRAGKSTLATRLMRDFGLQRIPGDTLMDGLGIDFPQLDISHEIPQPVAAERWSPFLHTMWKGYLDDEDLGFVFDSCHVLPTHLNLPMFGGRVSALFLGYSSISVAEMLSKLRHLPSEDEWTSGLSDQTLTDYLNNWISYSKLHEKQCQALGLPFFDVGADFEGAHGRAYAYAAGMLRTGEG